MKKVINNVVAIELWSVGTGVTALLDGAGPWARVFNVNIASATGYPNDRVDDVDWSVLEGNGPRHGPAKGVKVGDEHKPSSINGD